MAEIGGVSIRPVVDFVDLPWSAMGEADLITIPINIPLGVLIVAGLPSGATVKQIYVFVKFSGRDNTNALANSVSGAQNIQVQKNAGAFITCFSFVGGEYATPGSVTGAGGDLIMPSANVAALVPVNGDTLNVRWTAALAAQNNLNFNDIQVGARIFYD